MKGGIIFLPVWDRFFSFWCYHLKKSFHELYKAYSTTFSQIVLACPSVIKFQSPSWWKRKEGKERKLHSPLSTVYRAKPWVRYRFCVCTQSCLTLWDPMDCSPPGSSVHGTFQERILEWVARPSSWPRNWTWVSCISCIGR